MISIVPEKQDSYKFYDVYDLKLVIITITVNNKTAY